MQVTNGSLEQQAKAGRANAVSDHRHRLFQSPLHVAGEVAEHSQGDVFVNLGTKRAKRVDDGVEATEAIEVALAVRLHWIQSHLLHCSDDDHPFRDRLSRSAADRILSEWPGRRMLRSKGRSYASWLPYACRSKLRLSRMISLGSSQYR